MYSWLIAFIDLCEATSVAACIDNALIIEYLPWAAVEQRRLHIEIISAQPSYLNHLHKQTRACQHAPAKLNKTRISLILYQGIFASASTWKIYAHNFSFRQILPMGTFRTEY
jgi:hypothetical protein